MLDIHNYINNEVIDEYLYFNNNSNQTIIQEDKYSIFNVPSLFKPKIIEGHRSGGIKSFYRKLKKMMKFKKKHGGVCDSKGHPSKAAVKSLKARLKRYWINIVNPEVQV